MDTTPGGTGEATTTGPDSASADGRAPRLSIGLPVYNGERHLREAIDSLLAQDIGDFELVISDNASVDGTSEICREYADRDPRVRYSRTEANVGAAANFNRAFELCSGDYFMWGSDDDIWEPQFASRCIARLENSPNAVMCTSQVRFIGEDGELRTDWYRKSVNTPGMRVETRVHELLREIGWYGIYSVFRPSALAATGLYRPVFGGDVSLLLELVLQGEALAVPETLLQYRLPDERKTEEQMAEEIDPQAASDEARGNSRPWVFLATELIGIVRESGLPMSTITRIEDDFVDTLSFENVVWAHQVLRESGEDPGAIRSPQAKRVALRAALGVGTAEVEETAPAYAPWQVREGMQMSGLRKVLLKLLQPFGDRQNELDAQHDEALARLAYQASWLERRYSDLGELGDRGRHDGLD